MRSIKEYAKNHPELAEVIEFFSKKPKEVEQAESTEKSA